MTEHDDNVRPLSRDFLPIDSDVEELEVAPSPLRAIEWLLFVVLLVTAPAAVIAAWQVLL